MDPVFELELIVPPEALDGNRHVNNVVYLEWAQEAARRHAESSGCTRETRARGAAWFVQEHRIQYLSPALLGDVVQVRTWVAEMGRARSLRRTEVMRALTGEPLARAWTQFAFVDAATGRPKLIPPEVAGCFVLVPEPEREGPRTTLGTSMR